MSEGAPVVSQRHEPVGGVALHSIEAGSGDPPILLVHGLGSSVLKWRDTLPVLAESRRTIALDLPGCGQSASPRARYSVPWLAGAVRAYMDARGIERAVVVGNSLGGTVAMWLAAAWPDRVAALVLVAPALPSPPGHRHSRRTWTRFILPLVPGVGEALYTSAVRLRTPQYLVDEGLAANCADPSRVHPLTRELLIEEAKGRARPERRRSLLSTQRNLAHLLGRNRERVRAVAAGLAPPTLLLWGSRDRIVPLPVGEHWLSQMPGAELLVLEGLGHNPQVEDPAGFARAVLTFASATPDLSRTPRTPGS